MEVRDSALVCIEMRIKMEATVPTINFDRPATLLKAGEGLYSHSGDRYPGLKLNVGKTSRTWYYRGRIDGKFRSIKIGPLNDYTAQQALDAAQPKKKVAATDVRTVADGWREWCDMRQTMGAMSDKDRHARTRQLEMYASELLSMNVADVTPVRVQRVINAIVADGKDATARQVRTSLSAAFNLIDLPNPVGGKKTYAPAQKADDETPTQWQLHCAENGGDPDDWSIPWGAIMARREKNIIIGTAVAVMFLTGIRSENVRSLTWDQVSIQKRTIKLTRMKNGLAREMPVSRSVIGLFQSIRDASSEFVFPASSGTGYITDTKGTFWEGHRVFLPHDGRRNHMQCMGELGLSAYLGNWLRGDKGTTNRNEKMLMKYLKRMDDHDTVEAVDARYWKHIGSTPDFAS